MGQYVCSGRVGSGLKVCVGMCIWLDPQQELIHRPHGCEVGAFANSTPAFLGINEVPRRKIVQ